MKFRKAIFSLQIALLVTVFLILVSFQNCGQPGRIGITQEPTPVVNEASSGRRTDPGGNSVTSVPNPIISSPAITVTSPIEAKRSPTVCTNDEFSVQATSAD
ncbi:MAG: hypothetical protein IPK04_18925 [Bdellovibrionales bacterium]|nr:hypothetical protein [Bdellovibrionales bacterium]